MPKKDQKQKPPFSFSKKIIPTKVFICISLILFTLFSLIALINSSWIYRVSIIHTSPFGFNQLEGEQYYYNGPQPYLIEMPNLATNPEDLRPEIFFYEAPEAFLFKMDLFNNNLTSENYSSMLFEMMEARNFFNLYGRSTYGILSIDPIKIAGSTEPQVRVQSTKWGLEPKLALQIPDVSGDGYPDIFISVGVLSHDLPDFDRNRYDGYASYFKANPDEFNGYYEVEFYSNTSVLVHAKYSDYNNFLVDGKSLTTIPTAFSIPSDPVVDAIVICDGPKDQMNSNVPILVLAQSNIDSALYHDSGRYFTGRNMLTKDVENSLIGFELNRTQTNAVFTYTKSNISQFIFSFAENKDFIYIYPETYHSPIKSRLPLTRIGDNFAVRNVSLADSGSVRLQTLGNGFAIEFDSQDNFYNTYSLTWAVDCKGQELWKTEGAIFVSPVDFNKDGFREIGQIQIVKDDPNEYIGLDFYYQNESVLAEKFRFSRVVVMHPQNGSVYAMYPFLNFGQVISLGSVENVDFLKNSNSLNGSIKPTVAFTRDSKNPNAMNPDIVGIYSYDEIMYEDRNGMKLPYFSQKWFSFRLGLDYNYAQLEFGNLYQLQTHFEYMRFDSHCYLNYADIAFLDQDIDEDQYADYLISPNTFSHQKPIILIPSSLAGYHNSEEFPLAKYLSETSSRDFLSSNFWLTKGDQNAELYFNEANLGFYRSSITDHRSIKNIFVTFQDPTENARISAIVAQYTAFFYYEDLRYEPQLESFQDFFFDFSRALTIGSIIFLVVNILLAFIFFIKREKSDKIKVSNDLKRLNTIQKVMGIIGAIVLVVIEFFLLFILKPTVEYSSLYIGPQASLLWFIIIYPAIFPLFGILPKVYSWASAKYAGWLYIRGQRRSMAWRERLGWIENNIIVTKMEERNALHPVYTIKRALLPLSIAFTIGVWVYSSLGPEGLLSIFNIPAQTNPNALGIWIQGNPLEDIWAEMGSFARYCVFPMLVTYVISSAIIPSGWLLDDAGIAYMKYEKKYRGINDVEPLSSWLMNIISGIFGMSALISFVSLFNPMFAQLDTLRSAFDESLAYVDLGGIQFISIGQIAVVVIVLALVVYPFIAGIAVTVACMQQTEEDYVDNTKRLFKWMQNHELDPRTVEIKTVLKANYGTEPWIDQYNETNLGDGRWTIIVRKEDQVNEKLNNFKIDLDNSK